MGANAWLGKLDSALRQLTGPADIAPATEARPAGERTDGLEPGLQVRRSSSGGGDYVVRGPEAQAGEEAS